MMALSSSSTTNGPLITTTLLDSNTTLDYIAQSANDHCTKVRPQRLYIVTALTMMVGICQVVMGICRLDFITNFLSDQVIAGFTCGSAVHVFSTQIHYFFNCNSSICKVSAWEQNKNFFIVHVYWEILQGVAAMNGTAWMILAFSFATMLILVVGKEFVNSAVRKRMRIPLPWELVLVIIATSISKSADFDSQGVSVVEHMDAGFEPPRIPVEMSDLSFDMLLLESLNIAVVIFAINVSLAKVFAKKHGYKIDAKQELFALGLMQIIGSIFHCFAASPALARSSVYEHAGARTQVAAIFTSIIMFIVIQWLIPYLQGLPMCVLAAIIIVALKGMFLQIKQLPQLWNLSKLDFCTWLVTFCLTVFLGVSRALLYSVIFAMFTAVARQQISQSTILRRLIDTDIFLEEKYYKKVDHSRQNLIIFRYNAPLIFANVEHFKSQLMETIEQFINSNTYEHEPSHNNGTSIPMIRPTMRRSVAFRKFVVMDCSAISYCDTMGLTALNEAFIDVSLAGVRPIFACLNCEVRKQLSLTSFWQKVSQEAVFPTINDAIAYLED